MPQITAIKPQKRKERYNIYIDNKFAFGLDEVTLAKYRLKVGDELSEADLERFEERGELGKLFDKTLRFLAFRPRSEREIRDYLRRKLLKEENWEEKIEEILKRLKSLNYLDDRTFASWWVQQRQRQNKGARLIRLELIRKGISREMIDEVLVDAAGGAETDYQLALKAAKKKMPAYRQRERQKWRQKLGLYLARRGFDWETIKKVNQEIF